MKMIHQVISPYGFFDDWNDWIHNWKVKWGLYKEESERFPRMVWIEMPDYVDYVCDDELYIAREDIPKLIAYLEGKQRELQTD